MKKELSKLEKILRKWNWKINSMELKDSLAIVISSITLIFVTVQFFIKRKDTQREFVLNKRYDVYSNFLSQFSEFENEFARLHERTEELLNDQFTRLNEATVADVQNYLRIYYKPILNFNFNIFEFGIIGSAELDKEVSKLYYILDNRKRDIAIRIHSATTPEECAEQFELIDSAYLKDNNNEFQVLLGITYTNIKKLMKKDLGVKD